MYSILKAITNDLINQVKKYNPWNDDVVVAYKRYAPKSEDKTNPPIITFQWDEFSNSEDELKNGMITITLNTLYGRDTAKHMQLIEGLRKQYDNYKFESYQYPPEWSKENILKNLFRFTFNQQTSLPSFDELETTTLIYNVTYFADTFCC